MALTIGQPNDHGCSNVLKNGKRIGIIWQSPDGWQNTYTRHTEFFPTAEAAADDLAQRTLTKESDLVQEGAGLTKFERPTQFRAGSFSVGID